MLASPLTKMCASCFIHQCQTRYRLSIYIIYNVSTYNSTVVAILLLPVILCIKSNECSTLAVKLICFPVVDSLQTKALAKETVNFIPVEVKHFASSENTFIATVIAVWNTNTKSLHPIQPPAFCNSRKIKLIFYCILKET